MYRREIMRAADPHVRLAGVQGKTRDAQGILGRTAPIAPFCRGVSLGQFRNLEIRSKLMPLVRHHRRLAA